MSESQFTELAKSHLKFLRKVHKSILLACKGDIDLYLERAAERYWNIWFNRVLKIHLENAHNCDDLAPPLDIAWMWHVHCLSPVDYFKRSNICFEKPADRTQDPFQTGNRNAKNTQRIWKSVTKEKFVLKISSKDKKKKATTNVREEDREFISKLKQGAKSQLEYQIDRPEFHDPAVIKEAEIRYWKFMNLIASTKSATFFAVPTYDIDFIWHTHMACTESYRENCHKLAGFLIDHDFSDSDRSSDSKLSTSFQETRSLWESSYNENMEKESFMYRGPTPSNFFKVTMIPMFTFFPIFGGMYLLDYYGKSFSSSVVQGSGNSNGGSFDVSTAGGGCSSCGAGGGCSGRLDYGASSGGDSGASSCGSSGASSCGSSCGSSGGSSCGSSCGGGGGCGGGGSD
jgi:hypothetical protein